MGVRVTPELSAVIVSAGVTGAVALAGGGVLTTVSRHQPARAALFAPLVVVLSLAAGVAVATRQMVIGFDDYRTLLFVLLAGAPMAVLIGMLLARRVHAVEQAALAERADREREARVTTERRETIRWLSHDLRTPLSGIRLLAESLRENAIGDSGEARSLDAILRASDRLEAMVDDIAELSRLQGSETADRPRESADLQDLISDAASALRPFAEAGTVTIRPGVTNSAVVHADPASLGRALTNLVRNAVQHTPPGGQVVIDVDARPVPVVRVRDGCGGIPADDLARVFEPGWRGDQARTSSGAGMGLGLAIARETARSHGGDLTVRNQLDGSGCVFELVLPNS